MEWNYNPTKEQYEIHQKGDLKAVFPEKIASEVEVIVPGLGRVAVNQVTADEPKESLSASQNTTKTAVEVSRADMPEIPDGSNLKTNADEEYYTRLVENPASQPALYRRTIYTEGSISRVQFDGIAEDMGYNPDAGAHGACLLMLERIGDIERDGRGSNQIIRWD